MKVTGRVQWNAKGFAFVVVEGDGTDVFIPPFDLNGAIHGDTVEVACRRDRKGFKGHVTAILERPLGTVTGRFARSRGTGEIRPVSPFPYRIIVPTGSEKGAREGDIVVARLEKPQAGRKVRQLRATVEKILLLPEGGFGLIDFLDLRIKHRPLHRLLVRRNLNHLRSYLRRSGIEDFPWTELLELYQQAR